MSKRQIGILAAKLLFAAAALYWLFRDVDAARVWHSLREAHRPPIYAAFVLALATVAIAGWRWHKLLSAVEIPASLGALWCIAQIGQFFTMFLPGPVGDDLTRMLYISRVAKDHVGEACTTVVIDRIIGLASVLLLAVLCLPWQWQLLDDSRQTYLMGLGMIGAGAAVLIGGVIFFLVPAETARRTADAVLSRLPAGRLRSEATRMITLLTKHKRAIAMVIAAAFGTQSILCFVFHLAGHAVGVDLPFAVWFSFVPIVLAANAIPITVAGIGVREYLLVLFLRVLGQVESERALATSFVVFTITIAVALVGAVVYLLYRPHRDGAGVVATSGSR